MPPRLGVAKVGRRPPFARHRAIATIPDIIKSRLCCGERAASAALYFDGSTVKVDYCEGRLPSTFPAWAGRGNHRYEKNVHTGQFDSFEFAEKLGPAFYMFSRNARYRQRNRGREVPKTFSGASRH